MMTKNKIKHIKTDDEHETTAARTYILVTHITACVGTCAPRLLFDTACRSCRLCDVEWTPSILVTECSDEHASCYWDVPQQLRPLKKQPIFSFTYHIASTFMSGIRAKDS